MNLWHWHLYTTSIIALQEHRKVHDDIAVQFKNLDNGWQLITLSATRNTSGAAVGGVGFLLNLHASRSLCNVQSMSPRIIVANFSCSPATTVICCYSPTNCAEVTDVNTFYNNLRQVIKDTPQHNVLLVMGDFNAKIGKAEATLTYSSMTNRNGKEMLDLLEESDLKAINTCFQKKKGKLWTFQYPNGARSQLDYICINKKWQYSARDCSAFNSFISVGSDHRIVTAKLRLSLRAPKSKTKRVDKYDWNKFRVDSDLQQSYAVEVHNQFSILCSMEEEVNLAADKKYPLFLEAHKKAASKTSKKEKRKRNQAS